MVDKTIIGSMECEPYVRKSKNEVTQEMPQSQSMAFPSFASRKHTYIILILLTPLLYNKTGNGQ